MNTNLMNEESGIVALISLVLGVRFGFFVCFNGKVEIPILK